MSFDPNRKNKIMSILGRVVPSQRKNRTLLKKTVQMVMLSFWLPNYMEYTCKAWFYQQQQQQQKKKKKKKKKKNNTKFLGAYLGGYSIIILLYVGAFKKDMQKNSSIELTFISR